MKLTISFLLSGMGLMQKKPEERSGDMKSTAKKKVS